MSRTPFDSPGRRVGRGLLALLVLVGVEVGVPWLLAFLGLVPHAVPSWAQVTGVLRARDDGQLVVGVLAAGAWVCWAAFTASVISELSGLLRQRPAWSLPGLAWCQRPAAALLAAVVVGLAIGQAPAADADPPPLPGPVVVAPVPSTDPAGHQAEMVPASGTRGAERTISYTVQRRDTLWALAARHLGDGGRYPEIVALNPDVVGPDNTIRPGEVLRLPVQGTPTVEVRVTNGDTLAALTAAVSRGSVGWPRAWELNAGRAEPGGARFTDPDLIRPGWTLTLPTSRPAPRAEPAGPHPAPPVARPPAPPSSPEPVPGTPDSAGPASPHSSRAANPAPSDAAPATMRPGAASSGEGSAVARLGVFVGGGAFLAGGCFLALTRARRRQLRWREPGNRVPPIPAALRPAERDVRAHGTEALPDVTFLDRTLHTLAAESAATDRALPDVLAASLDDGLTLVLATPRADAPSPWQSSADGTRWTITRADADALPDPPRGERVAPYPLLASVGRTATGQTWLLDLERLGRLVVVGDPESGRNLLRYLAAELAHNSWSQPAQVALVGLGRELAPLGRERVVSSEDLVEPLTLLAMTGKSVLAVAEAEDVDVLAGRLHGIVTDAWAPRVLLADPAAAGDADSLADYLSVAPSEGRRTATALVWIAPVDSTDALPEDLWRIEIDAAGTLRLPRLGLELVAQQLPAAEAVQLAALLAAAATLPGGSGDQRDPAVADAPGPVPEPTAVDAWGERDQRGVEVGDEGTAIRDPAEEGDDTLDADLADWRDPGCPRPRIGLLGPVEVRTAGAPTPSDRELWRTEIAVYLALHPRGVSPERLGSDLWPEDDDVRGKPKVREAVRMARTWLGADPATGAEYLPRSSARGTTAVYRLERALVDADLFRRLRRRARARGEAGLEDLEAALELVRGEPFDPARRRPGGYGWLADVPVDQEYAAMIVDVAHEVADRHLAAGEPTRAVDAARVALAAHTGSDQPLLDLVLASDALGNTAEADVWVRRILANHDAEVEEDLPPRTAALLYGRRRRG